MMVFVLFCLHHLPSLTQSWSNLGANYEEEYCAEGWFIGYKYKGDKAGYAGRRDTNEADYSNEESSNGDFVKKEVNQDYTEDKAVYCDKVDSSDTPQNIKLLKLCMRLYLHIYWTMDVIEEMCTEFEKMMDKKFQMSSMKELTSFLGLQVTQKDDEIFLSQDKYVHEILKKFGFSTVKTASTPMETSKPLMKDKMLKMKKMCTEFEKMMHKKFQMSSMGELTSFLGLQVTQKDDGIFLSQDKYVHEILKKFGFSTVKTASTPMETSKPLMKDENAEDIDVHLYRSMIGSLMYLTSSRFQVTTKVSHLYAVKRIFRYLKGQPKLGLWYPKDSPFELEAYTDSHYAAASLDRKSTIGGCQFLRTRLIS
nr:uncharacterized mitochondrial protein AtMg00810-like [Tanacetum cinerariifolium]